MEDITIKRKRRTCEKDILRVNRKNDMTYMSFPALDALPFVKHMFTTRIGGVSQGYLGGLNLSYARGDKKENVDENFRLVARTLGVREGDFAFTNQTHTVNVRTVTEADRGKGMVIPEDGRDVDGLVTKERGIVLSAFFADCVPLYFVDPVKKAIGLCHSGWKGTVGKIGKHVVEKMQREFGTKPEDLLAAIGPSICGDCYEVGRDVAEQFIAAFCLPAPPPASVNEGRGEERTFMLRDKGKEKYLLDLWEANRQVVREAGILQEHISTTDVCTCCNPHILFSHRASKGMRGNMGAFLMLV